MNIKRLSFLFFVFAFTDFTNKNKNKVSAFTDNGFAHKNKKIKKKSYDNKKFDETNLNF